jgi:hypothetical protein
VLVLNPSSGVLAALPARGELARTMMPSPAPRDVKYWRRVGFTALTIGLVLIGLIVYAMLFAYR